MSVFSVVAFQTRPVVVDTGGVLWCMARQFGLSTLLLTTDRDRTMVGQVLVGRDGVLMKVNHQTVNYFAAKVISSRS